MSSSIHSTLERTKLNSCSQKINNPSKQKESQENLILIKSNLHKSTKQITTSSRSKDPPVHNTENKPLKFHKPLHVRMQSLKLNNKQISPIVDKTAGEREKIIEYNVMCKLLL